MIELMMSLSCALSLGASADGCCVVLCCVQDDEVVLQCSATVQKEQQKLCLAAEGFGNRLCFLESTSNSKVWLLQSLFTNQCILYPSNTPTGNKVFLQHGVWFRQIIIPLHQQNRKWQTKIITIILKFQRCKCHKLFSYNSDFFLIIQAFLLAIQGFFSHNSGFRNSCFFSRNSNFFLANQTFSQFKLFFLQFRLFFFFFSAIKTFFLVIQTFSCNSDFFAIQTFLAIQTFSSQFVFFFFQFRLFSCKKPKLREKQSQNCEKKPQLPFIIFYSVVEISFHKTVWQVWK